MKSKKRWIYFICFCSLLSICIPTALSITSCNSSNSSSENNTNQQLPETQKPPMTTPNPESEIKPILKSNGICKETIWNNNENKKQINSLNTTDNTYIYSFNSEYKFNREKQYANLGYYPDLAYTQDINFPGYPGLLNNWKDANSDAYSKIQTLATQQNLSFEQVASKWAQTIIDKDKPNPKQRYTDPNFVLNEIKNGTLKKHPSTKNMFAEFTTNLTQPAVSKNFSISSQMYNRQITGLYAPAGEIINLHIPKNMVEKFKELNIVLTIGDEWLDNVYANKVQRYNSFRMPIMKTSFYLNELLKPSSGFLNQDGSYDIKLGSVFGGSINLYADGLLFNYDNGRKISTSDLNNLGNLEFRIDNAIECLHYILGVTTNEEWNRLIKTTNTPIVLCSNDLVTISKPLFELNSKNKYTNYFYNSAKSNSPEKMMQFIKAAVSLTSNITSEDKNIELNGTRNLAFFVDDYINSKSSTSIGVNCSNSFISCRLSTFHDLFKKTTNEFGTYNNWLQLHEINHTYEEKFLPWNIWHNETYNNVLNVINNAAFATDSVNRNTPDAFVSMGSKYEKFWSMTQRPVYMCQPRYNGSGRFTISVSINQRSSKNNGRDDTFDWALLTHGIGSKNIYKLAKQICIMSTYKNQNNFHANAKSEPDYYIYNNQTYDYSAITAYLMCQINGVNLIDFINSTYFYYYLNFSNDIVHDRKGNVVDYGVTQKTIDDWNKLKSSIELNLPIFHPIYNFYASGPWLPKDKQYQNWEYGGDTLAPFKVDKFSPYYFNIEKYTKFSAPVADPVKNPVQVKSVNVLNNPKFGTIKFDNEHKNFYYIPNKDCKINDCDELIVQIIDSLNEEHRITIRPLISNISTYNDEIYTISPNGNIVNNQNIFNLASLSSSDINNINTQELINIFDNWDTVKNQLIISNKKEIDEWIPTDSYISENDPISINPNQIRKTSFRFKANKTGYYKICGDWTHSVNSVFDYANIKKIDSITSQPIDISTEILLLSTQNILNSYKNKLGNLDFANEQRPVYLESNEYYEINLFSINKNNSINETFKNVELICCNNDPNTLRINHSNNALKTTFSTNTINPISVLDEKNTLGFVDPKFENWFINNTDLFTTEKYINKLDMTNPDLYQICKSVKIANECSTPVDSNDVTINRLLGYEWNNVQFCTNSQQPNTPNSTTVGFDIIFNDTYSFNSIFLNCTDIQKDLNFSAQYAKIYELDQNGTVVSNTPIYDGLIDYWWNTSSSGVIKFDQTKKLSGIKILLSKSIDNRQTTPEFAKNISKKQNLKGWIRIKPSPIKINLLNNVNQKYQSWISNCYCVYSPEINYKGLWNKTSYNAVFENTQLISRYKNSSLEFNISNTKYIVIFGDKYTNSQARFSIYVDGKKIETFSNSSNKNEICKPLATIKLNDKLNHNVKLVVDFADENNPFSFQAIGIKNYN